MNDAEQFNQLQKLIISLLTSVMDDSIIVEHIKQLTELANLFTLEDYQY